MKQSGIFSTNRQETGWKKKRTLPAQFHMHYTCKDGAREREKLKEIKRAKKIYQNCCEKNFAVSCTIQIIFPSCFCALWPLTVRVSACSLYLDSSYFLLLLLFSCPHTHSHTHKCLLLWNSWASFAYESIYQKYSSCLNLIDNCSTKQHEGKTRRRRRKKFDGYFTNNNNVRHTMEKIADVFTFIEPINIQILIIFSDFSPERVN